MFWQIFPGFKAGKAILAYCRVVDCSSGWWADRKAISLIKLLFGKKLSCKQRTIQKVSRCRSFFWLNDKTLSQDSPFLSQIQTKNVCYFVKFYSGFFSSLHFFLWPNIFLPLFWEHKKLNIGCERVCKTTKAPYVSRTLQTFWLWGYAGLWGTIWLFWNSFWLKLQAPISKVSYGERIILKLKDIICLQIQVAHFFAMVCCQTNQNIF